jgi:isopenicillin-N epimerase
MSTSRRGFLRRAAGGYAGLALLPTLPAFTRDGVRTPFVPGDWDSVRAQFPIKEGLAPMNAANLCPAPKPVWDAYAAAARDEDADVSFQNRAKFDAAKEQTRAKLATYLGATADEIAIVRNTSEANNTIVGGVPLASGDEVVIWDQNHPTNNVAWDVRAARYGFTVKRVTLPASPSGPDEIIEVFRRALGPSTKVLAITDVSSSSGIRLPSKALCAIARDRGIHAHVDGAQSFGALRRDLHDLGCDSYSASSHKWFMGPKEAGVLYVRAERIAPIWPGIVSVGWGNSVQTTQKGARKFETLGQRNDATIVALGTTVDFHEAIGADRVEARMMELSTALIDGMSKIPNLQLVTPRDARLRAGVCIARFSAGIEARKVYEALYAEHRVAGAPTGGLRLSPHIYNTMPEIERAIAALGKLAARA